MDRETVKQRIHRFIQTAAQLAEHPTRENAVASHDASRDAWLSLFPCRKEILESDRALVEQFQQEHRNAVAALEKSGHAQEEDSRIYSRNLDMRANLLRSVLSGEKDFDERVAEERARVSGKTR